MFRRLVPHPYLTVLIAIIWMMLTTSIALGTIVIGLLVGLALPVFTAPYWPDRPRLRNWPRAVEYVLVVLWDIVVANVVVARIVVFMPNSAIRPAFVTVPLELRTPEAITVLAGTITMTPGTVSAEMSADGRALLVHCLHAPDPDVVRDEIKSRYERRLKEIFE